MTKAISFDDMILLPQYSEVMTREDVDLTMKLGPFDVKIPIISAPMDTVTGDEMAWRMAEYGALGIIHRYCSIEEQETLIKNARANTKGVIGASIGANGDFEERAESALAAGADFLCIDIAHGHHIIMKNAIAKIKNRFPAVHLMAGNIATSVAYIDLARWGADSIKVGISSGAACTTAINTGHGLPTLQSVISCKQVPATFNDRPNPPIIADGGIRKPGDLVKAFAVGASFCMLGSMLAGTKAAPGPIIKEKGVWSKQYRGSASFEAQKARGQARPRVEGISTLIPYKGKIENVLDGIVDGLKSACSYSGVHRLDNLHDKGQCVLLTASGYYQGLPHILG